MLRARSKIFHKNITTDINAITIEYTNIWKFHISLILSIEETYTIFTLLDLLSINCKVLKEEIIRNDSKYDRT